MTPEQQTNLLRFQVRAMISQASERFGPSDFDSLNLNDMGLEELGLVRKNLHELLYSPPPRR